MFASFLQKTENVDATKFQSVCSNAVSTIEDLRLAKIFPKENDLRMELLLENLGKEA